jgi:hypothetical protein
MTSFISLPLIRSYRLHGVGDTLTHLGWAREMAAHERQFTELFYPASHSISVMLADLSGVTIPRSMMIVYSLYAVVMFVFVPLVVRSLVGTYRATALGAFSGFLFLLINTLSTFPWYHTYTLATMFTVFFLFVLIRYMTRSLGDEDSDSPLSTNALGLVVAGLGLHFTHPQVMLNVLLLLGTIVVVRFYYARSRPNNSLTGLRGIGLPFGVLTVIWAIWFAQFPNVWSLGPKIITAAEGVLMGAAGAGETVGSQAQSATAVGATLPELFVKLFMAEAVYLALAAGTVLMLAFNRLESANNRSRSVVTFFGYAGLVLGPFFFLHFLGDVSHYFFRHFGFTMMIATILGAMALAYLWRAPSSAAKRYLKPVAVVLLVCMLALSLLSVFPSPYVFNQNHHVTDYQMNGYGSAFNHSEAGVPYSGIPAGPSRQTDGLNTQNPPEMIDGVTEEEVLGGLTTARDQDFYLPVTREDYEREVVAYREIRYSRDVFERLNRTPGVDQVYTNDGFTLYYVDSETPAATEDAATEDTATGDTATGDAAQNTSSVAVSHALLEGRPT